MESKVVYCKGGGSADRPLSYLKLVKYQVSIDGFCCWFQSIFDVNVIMRNARLTPENGMIIFLQKKNELKTTNVQNPSKHVI